jgi:hypothetical protein
MAMIDVIPWRSAMRLLALALVSPLVLSATLSAAGASDTGPSIARWGNTLIVTAPGGGIGEDRLVGRLNQKVTVDFKDAPIDQVADFLRQVTGANIVVAPGVAATATSVTLKASDMSLGNVLSWVKTLTNTHLGYVHGAIYLSDRPIEEASVTRMYDISDMVMPLRDFPGPELALNAPSGQGNGGARLLPPAESAQPAPSTDEIVDLIKKVVKPGDWRD